MLTSALVVMAELSINIELRDSYEKNVVLYRLVLWIFRVGPARRSDRQ